MYSSPASIPELYGTHPTNHENLFWILPETNHYAIIAAMSFIANILHRAFCVVYAWVTVIYCKDLFTPTTEIYTFYELLISFTPKYIMHYILNIASAIINVICLIPFFLIAFNRTWSPAWIWKWMLVLRLVGDLSGRFFEWQFFKSTFYSGSTTFIWVIMTFILFNLPSYLAHFQYAFKQEDQRI